MHSRNESRWPWEQDAPMGSKWKVFMKSGQGRENKVLLSLCCWWGDSWWVSLSLQIVIVWGPFNYRKLESWKWRNRRSVKVTSVLSKTEKGMARAWDLCFLFQLSCFRFKEKWPEGQNKRKKKMWCCGKIELELEAKEFVQLEKKWWGKEFIAK